MLEKLGGWVSPWVYGPLAVVAWVLILSLIKGIFLARIRILVQKTSSRWDDAVVDSARFPLTLLILGSAAFLLQVLLPLSEKLSYVASTIAQGTVIVAIVFFLDRLIRELSKLYAAGSQFEFVSKGIVQGLIRAIIMGLGLLALLDMMGVSITPALASLGIGSLTVGLALQDTLNNVFSGFYLSIDKPIRVGHFIKLESGEEGYITEIGWRSTRVQLLSNMVVVVPNHKIASSIVTNYHLPDLEIAVLVNVGVSYDSDLKHVEEVTTDVARHITKTVPGAVATFEPFIRYHTFDAFSINFTVILRAKQFVDQYLIKHEFIKALHERYKKEGIEIPCPPSALHLPKETLAAMNKNR